eukprot:gnl/TRDRNA2_/TRDRNA2_151767_c0_seq1.p1 gnl/TRDRNA2_/TRDRNA2_151767_c0~~gnl/TRDRNA2_/TRDRNA2_151767_c0_seq1.p1  ORF type:complete len:508 (-),score=62.15 gnl/TRDRNA2_/TRDRNA2_151767_c0_seq1:135-1658(-)
MSGSTMRGGQARCKAKRPSRAEVKSRPRLPAQSHSGPSHRTNIVKDEPAKSTPCDSPPPLAAQQSSPPISGSGTSATHSQFLKRRRHVETSAPTSSSGCDSFDDSGHIGKRYRAKSGQCTPSSVATPMHNNVLAVLHSTMAAAQEMSQARTADGSSQSLLTPPSLLKRQLSALYTLPMDVAPSVALSTGSARFAAPAHASSCAEPRPTHELAGSLSAFSVLPSDLVVFLFSFVDVRTKLRAMLSTLHSMKHWLQSREAWEPLHLDQSTGRALLRFLKCRESLCRESLFTCTPVVAETKHLLPKGFFEVCTLTVELMEADIVDLKPSGSHRAHYLTAITDPIEEICSTLRRYLSSLVDLQITNIEDYRMDYRFVSLRARSLRDFSFVELVHDSTKSKAKSPTYSLRARLDLPPRLVDVDAAQVENRSRLPDNVNFDTRTSISECDAVYLAEHRSAYKNGEEFRLAHSFYRSLQPNGVRKQYKAVTASLRKRFPDRFVLSPRKSDAFSP